MQSFFTLDYFKQSLSDAFFELPEIMDNPSHPQYENLRKDFENIDLQDLSKYVEENAIERFLNRFEDKHLARCRFYLIDMIRRKISSDRLEILVNPNLSTPYCSTNLEALSILENNLVSTSDFILLGNAFKYKEYVYHLSPSINASNSSYWIAESIAELIFTKKINFKIRLDPFIERHIDEYFPTMYKMTIYGTRLNWEELLTLKEDNHGRWMSDRQDTQWTDYVWRPEKGEIHFTCEELPTLNEISYRASRYFHAIFDKKTGLIRHCDGAIRFYNQYEYEGRLNFHVRNAEVRKIGKRVKIFQVDEDIDKFDFMKLVTSFMVWNQDVFNYFN